MQEWGAPGLDLGMLFFFKLVQSQTCFLPSGFSSCDSGVCIFPYADGTGMSPCPFM